jgi:dipeptidyl aminopeptidase/acylaminoacyl peptidase
MRLLAALVLASTAATAAAAETHPFNVRDLVAMDRVSDPRLSPDGKWLAFSLRETDMDANKGVNSIWLRAASGDAPAKRLTSKELNATTPRWSPDGKAVYFLSGKGGTQQVWRMAPDGGGQRQVTAIALDVGSFRVAPDGRSLAFSAEVFPDCDIDCTAKRDEAKGKEKASGHVYDKLFIRHWDTWANGKRSQLFIAPLGADGKAGAPVLLSRGIDGDVPSKPFGDDAEYAFAPDSKSLVFSVRIAGRTEPWSTNFDLFHVATTGSEAPRNLTDANDAWDTGPAFSADGKTLYYRAMKRPGFEADRYALTAMDLATGSTREIAPSWDRSADSTVVSADGKSLLTLAGDVGDVALFAIDIASGKATELAGDGTINAFDRAGDAIVFSRDDLDSPAHLYRIGANGGATQQLTDFNASRMAGIRVGDFEQFSFAGWNGETVHGYVVKPADFRADAKYPVAFLIHGGPQGSFGNHFHYRWNPQTYAGQGYAAVMIDFHGSTGYGQAFTDSISGDWGGKPLEDLKKGLAFALEKYPFLDGGNVCALGGSYGGFMTNWIAGNWQEPFKCLVSHSGVFDARGMGFATEELWFDEWERKGTPFDNPENYERDNPATLVAKWSVPMLVIHGQNDYRIPVEQGIAAFTALQRRGIESRFLYFPDENHWILKPANSILWHDTVNAWLAKHFATP